MQAIKNKQITSFYLYLFFDSSHPHVIFTNKKRFPDGIAVEIDSTNFNLKDLMVTEHYIVLTANFDEEPIQIPFEAIFIFSDLLNDIRLDFRDIIKSQKKLNTLASQQKPPGNNVETLRNTPGIIVVDL